MKCALLVVLISISLLNAQSVVKMQIHVQSYLQEKISKHRSGLLATNDYSYNYEEFQEGEYVRLISSEKGSFQGVKDIVSKGVGKSFQSINYYDNTAYLDSCKNGFKIDVGNLKKNQGQESKKLLKNLFPDSIAKQFDLFVVGTEYVESKAIPQITENSYEKYIKGKTNPKTESEPILRTENAYILLFQRVYNGRIIRSTDNYLSISVDKDGSVKNMEIAWQNLFPIEKLASVNNNLTEITQALELVAKSNYSAISKIGNGKVDTLSVKFFNVDGVARAWCKIMVDSENVLFPCLSYSIDVETSNGEVIPTIVDAPYSIDYRKVFTDIVKLNESNSTNYQGR